MTKAQITAMRKGKSRLSRGFDLSTYDRSERKYRIRCSQCEVLVIQGIPCHETGCPNARKTE